jgi:hypothetical protein
MSNGNQHDHDPLPVVVIDGLSGQLKGGRHIVTPAHTPMSNLMLALLDKFGVQLKSFGDSTVSSTSKRSHASVNVVPSAPTRLPTGFFGGVTTDGILRIRTLFYLQRRPNADSSRLSKLDVCFWRNSLSHRERVAH